MVRGPSNGTCRDLQGHAGDRLNFGLAAEQAKGEGFKVEVLVVGDDCSLPDKGPKARRGLAGTIMVYKVCSAARCISWAHLLLGCLWA